MKKSLLALLIISMVFIFTGCGKISEQELAARQADDTRYTMLVSYEGSRTILVDKDTGVMYLEGAHYITPLYNDDGTLRVWEKE